MGPNKLLLTQFIVQIVAFLEDLKGREGTKAHIAQGRTRCISERKELTNLSPCQVYLWILAQILCEIRTLQNYTLNLLQTDQMSSLEDSSLGSTQALVLQFTKS